MTNVNGTACVLDATYRRLRRTSSDMTPTRETCSAASGSFWLGVGRDGKPSLARYVIARRKQAACFLVDLATEEELLTLTIHNNTDRVGKGMSGWVDDFDADIDVRGAGEYREQILRAFDNIERAIHRHHHLFRPGSGPRLDAILKSIRACSISANGLSLGELKRELGPAFARVHALLGLPAGILSACIAASHQDDGPEGDCGW
jgi:hypothetical protein